jgi:hypothetical protein
MKRLHYSERVDKIMGFSLYRHRTLRTLFDCHSSEWDHTSMDKKLMLLELLMDNDYPMQNWISDYKDFFTLDLIGKGYVVDALPRSLVIMYKSASSDLRFKIFKSFVRCQELHQDIPQLNDLEISLQTARQMYG